MCKRRTAVHVHVRGEASSARGGRFARGGHVRDVAAARDVQRAARRTGRGLCARATSRATLGGLRTTCPARRAGEGSARGDRSQRVSHCDNARPGPARPASASGPDARQPCDGAGPHGDTGCPSSGVCHCDSARACVGTSRPPTGPAANGPRIFIWEWALWTIDVRECRNCAPTPWLPACSPPANSAAIVQL